MATPDRMTQRLAPKDQTLQEAYDIPANFLEIDVCNPETHGLAAKRYTDYEVRLKVGKEMGVLFEILRVKCSDVNRIKELAIHLYHLYVQECDMW